MLSPEQKTLCIKLYTEDEISIKEILSKTGIRSEPTIYKILKEAGIEKKRNRKHAKNVTISLDQDTVELIEKIRPKNLSELICEALVDYEAGKRLKAYRMKKHFESLCRVYKGEPENPIDQDEDEFRWYIWKQEEGIIRLSQDPHIIEKYHLDEEHNWEEYFRNEIDATIEMYAGTPYGGDSRKWYKRYFEL